MLETNTEPQANRAKRRKETEIKGRADTDEVDEQSSDSGAHESIQLPDRTSDGDGVGDIFLGHHLWQQGHTAGPVEGSDAPRQKSQGYDMPQGDPLNDYQSGENKEDRSRAELAKNHDASSVGTIRDDPSKERQRNGWDGKGESGQS